MTTSIEQAGPPLGTAVSAPPDTCPYCGGSGTIVYEDDWQTCWCQQPDADVAAKEAS